jgi:hypothetical protein
LSKSFFDIWLSKQTSAPELRKKLFAKNLWFSARGLYIKRLRFFGGPTWTRTRDQRIMSSFK